MRNFDSRRHIGNPNVQRLRVKKPFISSNEIDSTALICSNTDIDIRNAFLIVSNEWAKKSKKFYVIGVPNIEGLKYRDLFLKYKNVIDVKLNEHIIHSQYIRSITLKDINVYLDKTHKSLAEFIHLNLDNLNGIMNLDNQEKNQSIGFLKQKFNIRYNRPKIFINFLGYNPAEILDQKKQLELIQYFMSKHYNVMYINNDDDDSEIYGAISLNRFVVRTQIAIMNEADMILTPESNLFYFAKALNKKTLLLHGPVAKDFFEFLFNNIEFVSTIGNNFCSFSCNRIFCNKNFVCIKSITVKHIIEKSKSFLETQVQTLKTIKCQADYVFPSMNINDKNTIQGILL